VGGIRHSRLHGNLISPYSSEEENNKLFALAEMMHALTLEILRVSSVPLPPVPNSNDGAWEPGRS
jgi:hypothetical protein